MAIRDPWTGQASGPAGILDVEEVRLATGALQFPMTNNLKGKSGFRPGPASPGAVTATGTPDGSVHVSAFQLFLQGGRSTASGVYICSVDATVDINILSTPANATNPRDDLIIVQVSDTFYGDSTPSKLEVKQVVGTPAASPAVPSVSGSGDYIVLAKVRVGASVTTITNANITDLRTSGHANSLSAGLYSVAVGGILPVATQAQRDALTGLYEGLVVDRADLDGFNRYDGSGWRHFVRPTDASVATSQSTTATSYGDLATAGPAVTAETGTAALVTISSTITNTGAGITALMSFAITGATTVAALDSRAIGVANSALIIAGRTVLVTGLTPGSNVFTCKYKVNGVSTGTFGDRNIIVQPC